MRRVNKLPQNIQIRDNETMAIRGLNLTNNYTEGDLESVLNISSDHYPYFEPIRNADPITVYDEYGETLEGVEDFFYWDGNLFYIKTFWDEEFPENSRVKIYVNREISFAPEDEGERDTEEEDPETNLVYSGFPYYQVDGDIKPRQFAAISGKILIIPDYIVLEKRVEIVDEEPVDKYIGYYMKGSVSINLVGAVYSGKTITVASMYPITASTNIHVGQIVYISEGSTVNAGKTMAITDIDIDNNVISVDKDLTSGTEASNAVWLESDELPTFEFICSKDNRIWGCATETDSGAKKQIIYASALGNPYVFDEYSSLLGGWATEVECDDDWTGCAALPSTLLFFKERKIIRVLGNDPSEFTCYTSNVEGVKKGCWRSIVNINDTIYYLGAHGVYAYNGSVPMRLSERLGDKMYGDAAAGTDGIHYYIQMAEVDIDYNRQTPYTLYVYNLMQGFWTAHDTQTERMLFGQGNTLGITYLKGGKLYMTNPANDSEGIPFEMVFKPIYATITGSWNRSTQVFLKKRYLKTSIRMECGDEGTYTIYCQFDDGEWEEIGKRLPDTPTEKKSGVDIYAIPNNHCDRFRMKITGEGNVRLLGIQREYVLAGRR